MAAKPANARGGSRVSTPQPSRAIASDMKAPVRKSRPLAAKASRADKSALRRDAILAAALEEFSGRGFAAARSRERKCSPNNGDAAGTTSGMRRVQLCRRLSVIAGGGPYSGTA